MKLNSMLFVLAVVFITSLGYSRCLLEQGDLFDRFHFRHATKYYDPETGLYYYGERYYSTELGRWINRDPIAERGGPNLYEFNDNDGINKWDLLGMSSLKYTRHILDFWLLEVFETVEESYEHQNAPLTLLGLGDADSNISFKCSCVNKTAGEGADLSCKLVMRPKVRYPRDFNQTREHELRHVIVFENMYLPSFSELFSRYFSASKCCNCEARAAQINKYGNKLLIGLKKWDYQMEYFSNKNGMRAEPAIDYGVSKTPNYSVVNKVINSEGVLKCK